MKKLFLLLPFVFAACSQEPSTAQAPAAKQKPAAPAVGADRDAHGCIASAGYTYSVVQNKCIRLFEEGVPLIPTAQVGEPALVAYVVTSQDKQQAEVFLPEHTEGIVLQRVEGIEPPYWQDDTWMLGDDPQMGWILVRNKELLYSSKAQ